MTRGGDAGVRPDVSVVIPTHNRPEFLVEAVESALAQTVPPLEVIVVDDGSDTDPAPRLAPLGATVRLIRLPRAGGANAARNLGIDAAQGTVIAFLDDDDVWLPEKLARQLDAMAETGAEACLCGFTWMGRRPGRPERRRLIDADRLRRSSPCGTSGLVARRTALLEEPFDPAITRGQDWDIYVRLVKRRPLAFVPEAMFLLRRGHESITTAGRRQTPEQLYEAAASLHKHREWLGEPAYRRRLASILLKYVRHRDQPMAHIRFNLRMAGMRGTVAYLASRLVR